MNLLDLLFGIVDFFLCWRAWLGIIIGVIFALLTANSIPIEPLNYIAAVVVLLVGVISGIVWQIRSA